MTDHYSTLGVPADATPADIKRAYRKKASKSHPDKGGDGKSMADYADEILADLFSQVIEKADDANPLTVARSALSQHIGEQKQAAGQRRITRLTKQRGRVKSKTGQNLYAALIDAKVDQQEKALESLAVLIERHAAALKARDNYEADDPPAPQPQAFDNGQSNRHFDTFGTLFGRTL